MTEGANKSFLRQLPALIRVSTGTATVLSLIEGKIDAKPTTAYLMTYKIGKCNANCGFCPQARTSSSKAELLSRVSWPTFPTSNVTAAIKTAFEQGEIKRICIQALNYPEVFSHLEAIVKDLKSNSKIPVSVSCQPLTAKNIQLLAQAGVNRIGIALDAATEALFNKVKGLDAGGFYNWESQFNQLQMALEIFGKGNVSTHLIVGLGEAEKEAVATIQKCVDLNVLPALFAFTPIRGTALESSSQPKIEAYRRVQLARFLVVEGLSRYENFNFDESGKITCFGLGKKKLKEIVETGIPFLTSGCPDCNRPFYNEKPSGPLYNYPKIMSIEEKEKIKRQLDF